MKLVTQINNKIAIHADAHQWIIAIRKNPKEEGFKHAERWYLPTFEMAIQEIFSYLCRDRLADGKEKDLKQIAETILDIRKEIKRIIAPFEDVTPLLKARQKAEKGGKQTRKPNYDKYPITDKNHGK